MEKKMKKFTFEIQVDSSWIEDGYELNEERMHEMVWETLPHAYASEIKIKQLKNKNEKR